MSERTCNWIVVAAVIGGMAVLTSWAIIVPLAARRSWIDILFSGS